MAIVRLSNEQEFFLLTDANDNAYIGITQTVPVPPFLKAGQPIELTVETYISEANQDVTVNFNLSIYDSNSPQIQYPMIVGGRPKSRKKTSAKSSKKKEAE